jgi:hypothetical protein
MEDNAMVAKKKRKPASKPAQPVPVWVQVTWKLLMIHPTREYQAIMAQEDDGGLCDPVRVELDAIGVAERTSETLTVSANTPVGIRSVDNVTVGLMLIEGNWEIINVFDHYVGMIYANDSIQEVLPNIENTPFAWKPEYLQMEQPDDAV